MQEYRIGEIMITAKEFYERDGFECYDNCSHADCCIVVNADGNDKKELRKEFQESNIGFRCPIMLGLE